MRKIAIIYYSMSGNTEYVAKNISKKIEADLIKLVLIDPKEKQTDENMNKIEEFCKKI